RLLVVFACSAAAFSSAPTHVSLYLAAHSRDLHSFPTRRSSDLQTLAELGLDSLGLVDLALGLEEKTGKTVADGDLRPRSCRFSLDRKSTRLNSSHGSISYAVFCLKKKKKT